MLQVLLFLVNISATDPCLVEARARAASISPSCTSQECRRDALSEVLGACVKDPSAPVTLADCMAGSDDEQCDDWEDHARQVKQ